MQTVYSPHLSSQTPQVDEILFSQVYSETLLAARSHRWPVAHLNYFEFSEPCRIQWQSHPPCSKGA